MDIAGSLLQERCPPSRPLSHGPRRAILSVPVVGPLGLAWSDHQSGWWAIGGEENRSPLLCTGDFSSKHSHNDYPLEMLTLLHDWENHIAGFFLECCLKSSTRERGGALLELCLQPLALHVSPQRCFLWLLRKTDFGCGSPCSRELSNCSQLSHTHLLALDRSVRVPQATRLSLVNHSSFEGKESGKRQRQQFSPESSATAPGLSSPGSSTLLDHGIQDLQMPL